MTEPLEQFMKRWTHREYLTRLAWLDMQWNEPDRSDYYEMQTAMEVRRVLKKNPNRIKLDQLKIPFIRKKAKEDESEQTVEQASKASQKSWFARLGQKIGLGNGGSD